MKTRFTSVAILLSLLSMIAPVGAQPTSRPAGPGGARGEMLLQRINKTLSELSLSDEQKSKINEIITTAKQDMQKMVGELRDMGQEERAGRIREFMMGLRDKIQAELTDAQKKVFEEKVRQFRGPGGGAPTTQPGAK